VSTLSNTEIKDLLEQGMICIDPFDPDSLGTNSYDARVGEWYYREQHPLTQTPIYNIYCENSVKRIWGSPEKAPTYRDLIGKQLMPTNEATISLDDRIILLAPGETILSHTLEFIGGRRNEQAGIAAHMHARSSIGRSLLGVCKCAGYGDVGFINRWTMEITNFAQHHWIPLVVGRRVAQFEFEMIHDVEGSYVTTHSIKYQSSENLAELKKDWHPSMMLPRLHLDKDLDREYCAAVAQTD